MNISDGLKSAMIELDAKKNAEIKGALDEFWTVWTMEDANRRCRLERFEGSPVETLYADGVPILEIHPVELKEVESETGWKMRVTQNYRRLHARRDEAKK